MRASLLAMLVLYAGSAIAQEVSLNTIREDLFYSDFDLKKSFDFYESCSGFKDQLPVIHAYTAAAEALIAKYSWNPVQKFNYLEKSISLNCLKPLFFLFAWRRSGLR